MSSTLVLPQTLKVGRAEVLIKIAFCYSNVFGCTAYDLGFLVLPVISGNLFLWIHTSRLRKIKDSFCQPQELV